MKAQALSRSLLSAAVVFVLPFAAHAQLFKGFGVKVGANSSNTSLTYTVVELQGLEVDTGRRIGVNAAAFAEWINTPVFSIVTQVEYAERGFIQKITITDEFGESLGIAEAASQLNYVSLPILLKLRLPQASLAPYIVFGPRFDWLVDHVDGDYESDIVGNFPSSQFTNFFAARSWGATIGGGLTPIKFGETALLIEARYNLDFKDNIAFETLRAKNNAVEVWLGLAF